MVLMVRMKLRGTDGQRNRGGTANNSEGGLGGMLLRGVVVLMFVTGDLLARNAQEGAQQSRDPRRCPS